MSTPYMARKAGNKKTNRIHMGDSLRALHHTAHEEERNRARYKGCIGVSFYCPRKTACYRQTTTPFSLGLLTLRAGWCYLASRMEPALRNGRQKRRDGQGAPLHTSLSCTESGPLSPHSSLTYPLFPLSVHTQPRLPSLPRTQCSGFDDEGSR